MRRRVSILILSLTLSLLLFTPLAYGGPSDVLQVSFIDGGQGDSIWLHASDNMDILIDGGRRSAGPTVVAQLQSLHQRVSSTVVRLQLRQQLGDLEQQR
jgi:hypothetical protein